MKVGAFFFGGVEMSDAGAGLPSPMDRRYDNAACWSATLKYIETAVAADRLGFDSFWTTEHHFQYEGYEVIPNGILLNTWIAARTQKLRLGTMFNVVPQWNPLRLAEDFATMHNLSGGRGILGVGRGTVPRELLHLNPDEVSVGSADNPDQAADDVRNRDWFEEAMEVVRTSLRQDKFSYTGKYFQIPVPGIADRGSTVSHLTLIPRPIHPYEIWQAVTSPPTVEYVPLVDHGAVFWNQHPTFIRRMWDRYGELHEFHHGQNLARGAKRTLVVAVRIEDTHEAAVRSARNGHDEFWKFLGPYGWSRGYMAEDGKPAKPGLVPTLEMSMDQKMYLVGTAADVAEQLQWYRDQLGLDSVTIFPHLIGDPYEKAVEQMGRFMHDVMPLLL